MLNRAVQDRDIIIIMRWYRWYRDRGRGRGRGYRSNNNNGGDLCKGDYFASLRLCVDITQFCSVNHGVFSYTFLVIALQYGLP